MANMLLSLCYCLVAQQWQESHQVYKTVVTYITFGTIKM
jgi:hypothetical protein